MNTVQKFEYLKKETFNGQDYLKKHFLSVNPIVYTTDLTDYSLVQQYAETHSQVWLVDPTIQINENFPWWLRISPSDVNSEYEFPYVHKNSKNIKSWGLVKLVPTTGIVEQTIKKRNICGYYDVYNGEDKFDIFFLGNTESPTFHEVNSLDNTVITVDSITDAFELAKTDMFWIVPDGIRLADDFNFSTVPKESAYDYPHVFAHAESENYTGGVVLMSKNYKASEKEIEHNFYAKKRIMKQIASYPN